MDQVDLILHSVSVVLGQKFWMDLAKIILGLFMLGLSFFFFFVVWMAGKWHAQLCMLESIANLCRDDLMFQLTVARARLDEMKSRFVRRERSQPFRLHPLVLKGAGSLLLLMVRKEKSILQWGMLVMRLAGSLFNKSARQAKN